MLLVATIQQVSQESGRTILAYINAQEPGEALDNFMLMMDGAGAESISIIMDMAQGMSGEDKKNLLATAACAGEELDRFVNKLSALAGDHPGSTGTDVSNSLATAAKVGKELRMLLEIFGKIDLGLPTRTSIPGHFLPRLEIWVIRRDPIFSSSLPMKAGRI